MSGHERRFEGFKPSCKSVFIQISYKSSKIICFHFYNLNLPNALQLMLYDVQAGREGN